MGAESLAQRCVTVRAGGPSVELGERQNVSVRIGEPGDAITVRGCPHASGVLPHAVVASEGDAKGFEPGDSFDYVSGCPLDTASGSMRGSYRMISDDGEMFDVDIPSFSLLSPV